MSTPVAKPQLTYQFPARPRCTPARTASFVIETTIRGLVGGSQFGGILGVVVVMLFAIAIGIDHPPSPWKFMLVSGPVCAALLGWQGYRTLRGDGTERDNRIVGTILFVLAGGIIGAPIVMPFTVFAWLFGCIIGAIPGIVLWSIYGIALVIFTVRRYSPSMDVAAFRSDARRLAALTTWLAIGPVGTLLYLFIGNPTSNRDILTALGLLLALATITAPFAWWHSKFLIDWWLGDIEKSGAS